MKCINLIGNAGRNAERSVTSAGREIMRFSLAVTNRDGTTIWCSVITNFREGLFPYIVKGKQLFVQGDFEVKLYNGQPTIDVYADKIELIGAKVETKAQQITDSVSIPQTGNNVESENTY